MPNVVSDELINISVRNQGLLEAVKNGLNAKFRKRLVTLQKRVNDAILTSPDVQTSKKIAKEIERAVNAIQVQIYAEYLEQFNKDLAEVGLSQSAIEATSYAKVVIDYKPVAPTLEQVVTAYTSTPLQVEDSSRSQIFKKALNEYSKIEIQRVNNAVSGGYLQGRTNAQIARAIKGTKALNYKDGILSHADNSNRTMVRTMVQHVATQSRMETMKRNSDLVKGYRIVVTFDSKTTTLCMDVGQKNETFEIGKGLMPPLHWGCRDTITPVLDSSFDFLKQGATRASKGAEGGKQVDAKLGSYDWMLKQPRKWVEETRLGKTRTALLFDGGMTPTEFARLSTNSNNVTLTIEQMKIKAPLVFETAGL